MASGPSSYYLKNLEAELFRQAANLRRIKLAGRSLLAVSWLTIGAYGASAAHNDSVVAAKHNMSLAATKLVDDKESLMTALGAFNQVNGQACSDKLRSIRYINQTQTPDVKLAALSSATFNCADLSDGAAVVATQYSLIDAGLYGANGIIGRDQAAYAASFSSYQRTVQESQVRNYELYLGMGVIAAGVSLLGLSSRDRLLHLPPSHEGLS